MHDARGSLVVTGSGIKFMSHLSVEAMTYIQQSEKVLYSVNEPAMESWIKKNNSNTECLDVFDDKQNLRIDFYQKVTDYIVKSVKKPQHVCVVFYGHPTIFARSALNAALKIKQEGYVAKILPAISAEDCLYADLCIDPGSHGCQSFETTDLLIRQRHISVNSHLVLWQIGMIGALRNAANHDNSRGLQLLFKYLRQFYPETQPIFSYEAALYPHTEPKIVRYTLSQLPEITFSPISTLYIPPIEQVKINREMLASLGISFDDLKA